MLSHRLLLAPGARSDERDAVVRDALERVPASLRRGPRRPCPAARHGAARSRALPGRRRPSTRPRCTCPASALVAARGRGRRLGAARRARRHDHERAPGRTRSSRRSRIRCASRSAAASRRRPAASCSSRCSAGRCPMAGRWSRRLRINVRFSRRGRRVLEPALLVLRDPLRLFSRRARRRRRRGGARAAADRAGDRAWKRRRRRGRPAAASVAAPGLSGRRLDASLAELEIDGLRPYREGAPASRIHWPSVARTGEMLERRLVAELDSAPLIVLDPSAPASEEALDAAVRAAASLCVWLAHDGGCSILLPGDRRPIEVGHDLGAWPAVHVRLALVEEGPAPPASTPGSARRRGDLGDRRGPAQRAAQRSSGCPPASRYVVTPGRRCPARARRSRWPAAPASWSSARAGGWPRERPARPRLRRHRRHRPAACARRRRLAAAAARLASLLRLVRLRRARGLRRRALGAARRWTPRPAARCSSSSWPIGGGGAAGPARPRCRSRARSSGRSPRWSAWRRSPSA